MTSIVETYRDEIRRRSPTWLQRGVAERYLYALALHVDIFGDALIAGVKHRFPGLYSFEALGLLGRERRISRGRVEADVTYAGRLRRWLTDHQLRGGPHALLAQLVAHYAPATFPIDLVYYSGRRFRVTQAGLDAIAAGTAIVDDVIERDDITWEPDTNAAQWARWWLFYFTDQWTVGDEVVLSDAELEDLRLVPREWNAAHPIGHIVVFPSGAELYNYPTGRLYNRPVPYNTTVSAAHFTVEAEP